MDEVVAAAIEANEAAYLAGMGRLPRAQLLNVDGALLVDTGRLGFARVLSTEVSSTDLRGVVAQVRRSMIDPQTTLQWAVGHAYSPPELVTVLESGGFRPAGAMPAMAMSIDAVEEWRTLGPPGLEIEAVTSADEFRGRYLPVLQAHFGLESGFLAAISGMYELNGFGAESTMRHLVGSMAGKPPEVVGTALLAGGAIGIHTVATLKAVRGQGLGTAMTAALATCDLAAEAGFTVLHATPSGLPVYERLGYAKRFETAFYSHDSGR